MKYFALVTHAEKKELFSGYYKSLQECIEQAIGLGVNLARIDLKNRNLSGGNFDGACMPHAKLDGANLTGANLSEACLHGSSFRHASFYNTCLCYSDLRAADFRDSDFGGTDVTGADISFCRFSTLSCFDLSFTDAVNMLGCVFESPEGMACKMSQRPIVLKGIMNTPIVIMDQTIKIGASILNRETCLPLSAAPALPSALPEKRKAE